MYVHLTLVVIENNHIIDDYKQHNICIVTILINNHIQLCIVSHTHHNMSTKTKTKLLNSITFL